ncbi:molybdenum ABC transporter ATP-binding protein ModC [Grimontia sp. NTOU-MAR1]|uniref:molybdenum ABC transporter ATP-binding protein ModC n=1 Tax=Grimontia sp. NTOU-MAR1 TaxID=3111011 RepID=UPI002DB907AA|nr:molybdenum ABC transporter ATP-binding protein ModC [Grimontia sp. NTOU-MAR1]WRV99952.1 molybdenum ABC transporter ATP-binding protein ModC [Grimontia sp. NTOU-MAR1]
MITLTLNIDLSPFQLSVDETIPSSGITAVFGRSGAGKTSLINAVSGLVKPDAGRIALGEKVLFDSIENINLAPEHRRIGYVFQEARLFPHMSVEKNLKYGQRREDKDQFDEITQLLGIEHLLERYPSALSGGEKQRVAIGRALLSDPELLIMDEPTASLDGPRRQELIQYLLRLTTSLSVPVLYVSHSLDEILQIADNMLILNEGKTVANGPLHDVWGSAPMRPWLSAKEQSALVTAKLVGYHPIYGMAQLDLEGETVWVTRVEDVEGSMLRLRIFANDISIVKSRPSDTSIRNILPAVVEEVCRSELGDNEPDYCQVVLRVGNQRLLANITRWAIDDLGLSFGDVVFAQLKGVSITKGDLAQEHKNFY